MNKDAHRSIIDDPLTILAVFPTVLSCSRLNGVSRVCFAVNGRHRWGCSLDFHVGVRAHAQDRLMSDMRVCATQRGVSAVEIGASLFCF